jgi:hypothetical protein
MRKWDVYVNHEYRNLGILLFIADVLIIVLNNSLHDVIKRSVFREAFEHFKHSILVLAVVLIYFFSSQLGDIYSRIVLRKSDRVVIHEDNKSQKMDIEDASE